MDWLSLCVCATKSDDEKPKKNEKRKKKSKKYKKLSKQKESDKVPSLSTDESLRKSQNEEKEIEKEEIAEKNRMNREIVDRIGDRARSDQIDPTKIDDSPIDSWSYRSDRDDCENFDESLKENSANESERNISRGIDCNTMHLTCASSAADEDDEKRVKCISDEKEREEETNLDESMSRSVVSGEPEDSSWTSEDRQDAVVESSLDRKLKERISSRINFPNKNQKRESLKGRTSLKKQSRNALPPIKRRSEETRGCIDSEEMGRHKEMNKFAFKNNALFCEQSEIRRKLNSCSFEIRPFENEERGEKKMRIRDVGSMIPRLSSPRQGINSIKTDGKSEIVQNGRIHSAVVSGVNLDQRTVTVEWFEKGETKGKEVEIDAILALNPDLNQNPEVNHKMGPPAPVMNNHMLASSRARHSTRPSIPVKATSNRQLSRPSGRPTNIMSPASSVNGHGDAVAGLTGRREVENIPPTPTAAVTQYNLTSSVQNRQQKAQQQQQQQQQQMLSQAQVENGRGRRSNVVKEVERLKKNREERRQRQAELKEEKEALMNLDPGNPNWEFLAMIREYQNSIEFRPLRESDPVEDHQITVCVRKRPLNKKEHSRKEIDVISVPSKDQMVVHEPKSKVDLTKYLENQIFRFDYAFDETCNNEIVYKYTAKPLVQTIFEGGMATCFAYGQTGSGKTHTMGGDFNGKTQDCKKGIYAMVAKDVFKCLKLAKYRPLNLVISASFFEIYSGKVFDLLAEKEKLRVLEDGKQQVQIVGLTEKVVETCDEVLKLIQHGNSARTSGQTSANSNSSRSHAVFQIIARIPGTHKVHGKFSLIDLAGNERGADTSSANRQTRMEGAEINKSLLALKECIRALSRKGTHLPFRASKLTQVLRDSFIGEKSKTCMIAMISPGMSSCEHSLNTLRYADRVKELAATDPTEIKASPTEDDRGMKIEEQANNSVLSDSDLAQLRSLNEGELSQDLYTFHEAVSALQMLEEEVLDTHKLVMDNTTKFLNDAHSVFSATHEVDYDQEDSHNKTKANSIVTLNRQRRSNGSTLPINSDTDSVSDAGTVLNATKIDSTTREKLFKSPWEDEIRYNRSLNDIKRDTDNSSPRTIIVKHNKKKSMTPGRIVEKNLNNKDTIKCPIKKCYQSQRSKLSTGKKKLQKYNLTGTFHKKTNLVPKETNRRSSFYISSDDFVTSSEVDENDERDIIDICMNKFDGSNYFRDYDIEQDKWASPIAFSDVNVTLEQRTMCDQDTYNVDSHTRSNVNNEDEDNFFSGKKFDTFSMNKFDRSNYFRDYDVEHDKWASAFSDFNVTLEQEMTRNRNTYNVDLCAINNINEENEDNLSNDKKFVDSSMRNKIKLNFKTLINDTKNTRPLVFLGSIILFLLLEYILLSICFTYIMEIESK
ncbi:kinesin-related protein 13-like isoform X3 [Pseudomyrmex gracilis]|uniref:kinesin-related protein 13-like isoform X3 n=1 Tax=Pseudomyrmex gracilis TaxID=219809 RepID=UPI000994D76C|nr:kinesin-related protein 13-like isoform X3 [Pseudomyrmex gracilis]